MTFSVPSPRVARALFARVLCVWFVAVASICHAETGGAAPGASSAAPETPAAITDIRPLDPAVWSRKAVAYSGFRAGQSPADHVFPSRREIVEDLGLLRAEGFGLIRVYSSGPHGRAIVEAIAAEGLDFRVQLGVYLSGSRRQKGGTNRAEIEAAVELANAYPEIVVAVSVGNETLVGWSFVPVPPADMIDYVREVRSRVRQPVTVNDNWAPYAAAPGTELARVWGQIDYASVHTYPYWDAGFNLWDFRQLAVPEERRARAMMNAARDYAWANFAAVRASLDAAGRRIPIVIGETGWQNLPTAFTPEAPAKDFAAHEAHPVNQAWYFADMMAWAYGEKGDAPGDGFSRPAAMFYFSAFDEPWKKADDNWGLWDAARRPKVALRPQSVAAAEAVCFRPPRVVRVVPKGEGWALTRDGEPYEIKGVGGHADLALAKRLGATTIRTWGVDQLEPKAGERPLLDRVAEEGLTAMVGLWIGHERHGFDYGDPAQVARQREAVREAVRKYRGHPALLVWGLGNEMEGEPGTESSRRIFRELEELAKIIKAEDPDHPVCMVVAVGERAEVEQIRELAPSVDILGVNAYGSAPGLAASLAESGWTKPFILAEFGPLGHWEVSQTPWGAPIEPTSEDKAARYASTYERVFREGQGRCVGAFAFVWGWKQETTSTWYGMFLRSGEKLPSVDAMARAWSGRWPENRCPAIKSIQSAARLAKVAPGARLNARAEISDPEGDPCATEWFVVEESTDRRQGGDREAEPARVDGCVVRAEGGAVEFSAPARPGAYRLFLVVRDGKGGASADNFPFFVEAPAKTP